VREKRKPSHGRGMLTPWQPGQSGNPSGLSKLEGQMIRAAREEGLDSVRFLVAVRDDQVVNAMGKRVAATVRERTVAAALLLDRGFGKPHEHVELKEADPSALERRNQLIASVAQLLSGQPVPK
jgi:hypothetical protein